ncbi:hypothetical protein [Deinococcus cellulosilyticus]|uniref:Uncharacterized protein n=1 Tax=Deinococcus cellulosilyticus (strain DSM 18568 / NBRC 106333 / KACC 11606 / 5516J-15) TaxID=1223518 RepID=A0A511NBZ6_DEIC1|nr:hypothetical protein [Deinococcus cellulosilyticus]GEM50117.1 hypothetical protein DC3_57520 [Deinococcus cellulosilyticus NBRC 106333 = KACC 11606]
MDNAQFMQDLTNQMTEAAHQGRLQAYQMMYHILEPHLFFAVNSLGFLLCAALAIACLIRCAQEVHAGNVPMWLLTGMGTLALVCVAGVTGHEAYTHASLLGGLILLGIFASIIHFLENPWRFLERLAYGAARRTIRDSF